MKGNKKTLLFFTLLGGLLLLRLFSDHTQNFHYTGDFHAEQTVLLAAENFQKLGIAKTRGIPIFKKVEDPSQETTESLRPIMYTHFPPGPWWLFSGVFLTFNQSEIAARVAAILISLLGLLFAMKSVQTLASLCQETDRPNSLSLLFAWSLLVFNPSFLCFADTIQQHPLTETLQWASFYWCLHYLFFRASLKWGIVLYFLHVWISFEWLVPFFLIIIYCLWEREGSPLKNPKPWILFFALGFLLPIGLRLAQNSWALGGSQAAWEDLFDRARVRSLGDPTVVELRYSLPKHLGKIFFGLPWFVGIAPLIIFGVFLSPLKRVYSKNKKPIRLLLFWGLGSVSWQFLMPQNAMVHAYSQIHIANFILLVAAAGTILFWNLKKEWLVALMLLYFVEAGMFIKTEIVFPFVSQSLGSLSQNVCAKDRALLAQKLVPLKSSVSRRIQKNLSEATATPLCDRQSRLASRVLNATAYGLKSRLEHHPLMTHDP